MAGRGGVRGRAGTWPDGQATHGRPALQWPQDLAGFLRAAADHGKKWLLSDLAVGRLLPWLPIAFGTGIVLYFTAGREPVFWAPLALTLGLSAAAFLLRRRSLAFPVALAMTAMAAGFATVTLKSALVAHPILRHAAWNVSISGFVHVREERERSDRIVVRVHKIEGGRLNDAPDRVRVSVRKGTAPPVGSYVELKARLNTPLAPLRPGGYDFARDLYFQGIGAVGFVLGTIKIVDPPIPPDPRLRYLSAMGAMRDAIDSRIRAVVPGDKGAIASALITGKRDTISAPVNDAMYVSSLAHVLSISGYHMALVAGVVFFTVRALLALVPSFASRFAIKKWAALAALAGAAFYLALSGAEVATQRAFIMTAIVLIGVVADRQALTLRTLAIAALAVLLIAPESVAHPSFQMSFAATLALVAAYERGLPWMTTGPETSFGARVALWGGREIVALILASIVAGLATTLYAAFHFHRLAPYGVLANLLAMPIVSLWVMPAGLLALIAIPFGFDSLLWQLMGEGIGWMIAVALWVASLPGAVGRIHAFGTGTLLIGTAGILLLCLLRSPLRWSGAFLVLATSVLAVRTPQPDVLLSADARIVGVRGSDGRLVILKASGADAFAVRSWLAADADPRSVADPSLSRGASCDSAGCIGRAADGKLIALSLLPEAFEEDCARAAIVVTAREAPAWCSTLVVDRKVWRSTGALALHRGGNGFEFTPSRPQGYDRPWARAVSAPETGAPARSGAPPRPSPRDATPRVEDLEPGD
jgi:competence protein ComEC